MSQLAADFHATLALGLTQLVYQACERIQYKGPVMLTGGCMANRLLTAALVQELGKLSIESYFPQKVPAGDGGIALGQVWLSHLMVESGAEKYEFSGDL